MQAWRCCKVLIVKYTEEKVQTENTNEKHFTKTEEKALPKS